MRIGIIAALAAALIGSAWQITSRHGVTTSLGPLEVAVLRYGVPTLALLPLLWRGALFPRDLPAGASHGLLLIVAAGGGLPFGLIVLAGAQWAPAAHMGIFMAGALPLFTALGAWLTAGETLSRARLLGLGLLCAGIASVGLGATAAVSGAWRGDLLFLLAAVLWAAHSLAFRRCGLSPWQGAAFVNGWSFLCLLPIAFFVGVPRFQTAPAPDLALQAVMQGLVAGLLGLVTYLVAVARLGATRAALSAALVPVLTAVGAAGLLSEPMTVATWVALALVVPGVTLASGAGGARRRS